MARRRALHVVLLLLGLFLLGTVIVLSSVSYYLAIEPVAYLNEHEIPFLDNTTRWNATEHGGIERIPRIIHQTWKSETLPVRWQSISKACRDMMSDYEYKLWTDAGSREFIAENYPWFLDTFDNYTYAIQRADAIRYFVLHYYGGIYMDLDIGCLRPMDPLLVYPVILPKTIPVGVSNDLILAEKGHPFLTQTIHNLIPFDHSWIINYPTVMFSTGPMFLSAQYGLYTASHADDEVRILPKSLYGKNAKEGEAPHSFFSHFYGSSWHSDDAAFIGFLGTWGKGLMWVGIVVLLLGLVRLAFPGNSQGKYGFRRAGGYEVLLPRWTRRNGRWHLDLGWSSTSTRPLSSDDSDPGFEDVQFLPFNVQPPSPTFSEHSSPGSILHAQGTGTFSVLDAIRRFRNRIIESVYSHREESTRPPTRSRRQRSNRGVLFFLPAIFTQSQDIELSSHRTSPPPPSASYPRAPSRASDLPTEKQRYAADLERAGIFGDGFSEGLESERASDFRSRSPSETTSSSHALLLDLNDVPIGRKSRSRSASRDS